MENLLPFLLRVMSARDPYAQGHADQVTELASSMAREIGLTPDRTRTLEFAARIHDIGKIAITEAILNKPGRFTEAEFVMVQHHAVLGANLIAPLGLDPAIQQIILHHHENFDGTGYPQKINGEQIQLEARILRIADTYDALTHDRVYRKAHSSEEACAIMRADSRLFDPHLLETFFKMDAFQS